MGPTKQNGQEAVVVEFPDTGTGIRDSKIIGDTVLEFNSQF